jgi:hypothetical protein
MRQWLVDPAIMCRKHLLGEHVEHHMFMGSMNKGINVGGYIRNNLLEIPSLASRHEALVKEMQARGYNHHSPLAEEHVREHCEYYPEEQVAYVIDREAAHADLLSRCPECRARWEAKIG